VSVNRFQTDDDTRADMRRWLDNWKLVGPILDAERVANLRNRDETESARIAVASLWPMTRIGAGDWYRRARLG
jgi:hypothetical protein